MEDIRERLKRGDVIVGDGSLGTLLYRYGLKQGEPPESFTLTKPHILEEIASLYLEAGAEIITTNSFGGSSLRLQQFSMDKDADAINRRAAEAVRKAVGRRAYVSASIGPTARLKPLGDADPDEVYASFRNQIHALLAGSADIVCVETMTDLDEAILAVKAARSLDPRTPIMATMTFNKTPRGFFTIMGVSIARAAEALQDAGASIIGSNCGNGSENMVEIAREFVQHSRLPVAIQSNAGLPVAGESGLSYPETPDFLARKADEMLKLGVQIIGGCCGTGPDHIRAIRETVDAHLSVFRD
jgi:5-methyltetrahydrofolate--homocysteine methyltransferase